MTMYGKIRDNFYIVNWNPFGAIWLVLAGIFRALLTIVEF